MIWWLVSMSAFMVPIGYGMDMYAMYAIGLACFSWIVWHDGYGSACHASVVFFMSSKVKVVSDAVQDIPHGALLVELTPDGKERCLDCWNSIELCYEFKLGMKLFRLFVDCFAFFFFIWCLLFATEYLRFPEVFCRSFRKTRCHNVKIMCQKKGIRLRIT